MSLGNLVRIDRDQQQQGLPPLLPTTQPQQSLLQQSQQCDLLRALYTLLNTNYPDLRQAVIAFLNSDEGLRLIAQSLGVDKTLVDVLEDKDVPPDTKRLILRKYIQRAGQSRQDWLGDLVRKGVQ
jgi:phage-related baseplate assembly protein